MNYFISFAKLPINHTWNVLALKKDTKTVVLKEKDILKLTDL